MKITLYVQRMRKRKKKKAQTKECIPNPGVITVGEDLQALQTPQVIIEPTISPPVEAVNPTLQRQTRVYLHVQTVGLRVIHALHVQIDVYRLYVK